MAWGGGDTRRGPPVSPFDDYPVEKPVRYMDPIRFSRWHVVVSLLLLLAIISVVTLVPPPTSAKVPHRKPPPHHRTFHSSTGKPRHLIMVAGHAVLTATDQSRVEDEESWYLQESQKGQLAVYLKHIQRGVEMAADDQDAVLIFSGGQTRSAAGPRSEAQSYWIAADVQDWFGYRDVMKRTFTEEFAKDSYENLIFSICRFREVYSIYPERITVISYNYKKNRFVNHHRRAIRYPQESFNFEGVDPPQVPYNDGVNIKRFALDPYGCHVNEKLRKERNPFHRTSPYPEACPELHHLLDHCGPALIPKDKVPWATHSARADATDSPS